MNAWGGTRITWTRLALAALVIASLAVAAIWAGTRRGGPAAATGAPPGATAGAPPGATGTGTDGPAGGAGAPAGAGAGDGDSAAGTAAPGGAGGSSSGGAARAPGDLGGGVRLVGDGLPAGLAATRTTVDPSPDHGLATAGPGWQLSPSGPLHTSATVSVPTGPAPHTGDVPVLVTSETAAGPWQVLPTSYDGAAGTASATLTHFSFLSILWVPVKGVLGELDKLLNG